MNFGVLLQSCHLFLWKCMPSACFQGNTKLHYQLLFTHRTGAEIRASDRIDSLFCIQEYHSLQMSLICNIVYILGQYIQLMHRSRIPGVESRLGSTWHRLNHNRAVKRAFQQCWTVKPEIIQLLWCKNSLVSARCLETYWMLSWGLLTNSFLRTESCFPLHLGQSTASSCSQLGKNSGGGTLLVLPGRLACGDPSPPTLAAPTVLQPGQGLICGILNANIAIALKNGVVLKHMSSHGKKVLPFLWKYWSLLLG